MFSYKLVLFSLDGLFSDSNPGEDHQPPDANDHLYSNPVQSGIYAPRINPIPLPPVGFADRTPERAFIERNIAPSIIASPRSRTQDPDATLTLSPILPVHGHSDSHLLSLDLPYWPSAQSSTTAQATRTPTHQVTSHRNAGTKGILRRVRKFGENFRPLSRSVIDQPC